MHIDYSHKAMDWLDGASTGLRRRIMEKTFFYASQVNPLVFAKYIPAQASYRFRVGNYRVLFRIEHSVLKVSKIERRDKAYD